MQPDWNVWNTWQEFRAAQQEMVLAAGKVAHIPVTIRYIDSGEARLGTILLMHGIPTWGYLYHAIIPTLVQAGYRVLAPDFLGHGWSDRRDRFDRSFQDQARMIIAFLSNLNLKQVNVVGHDTGGAVALILAIEHPQVVDRLVITNSVCYDRFDDDMLDFGHPLRWKPRPIADLVSALEESLAAGLSNPVRLTPEFRAGMIAPWSSEEGKLSLIRNASALNANQTMALVDRHGAIAAPTLILWGMDDPWQKADDGRQLAREIPGATFQEIEGASHWVQQDAPEQFSTALLNFFKSSSSR
ncbi:MAG: alpha/beta fold hydrolase [Leptolyngbyaceae cyanobacterium RM2_2_4]|nr:alpha/beta fold hydrolase [Leptolyngbyaceae cyanobacterium SM1_4_3]NJN56971.1 alpha/beta fold hydrolase [Leptolyngbyaceae cyanobacterium SL_5_9]NJO52128.1 alpha/beta fold hydrolase [Leptolyngbyaceae cyanobacterium RM2_2_4]NJO73473.1 alpha/beta fold hydrolase [Leptolyngbyaceae cyanobacterium RM1_406_9]